MKIDESKQGLLFPTRNHRCPRPCPVRDNAELANKGMRCWIEVRFTTVVRRLMSFQTRFAISVQSSSFRSSIVVVRYPYPICEIREIEDQRRRMQGSIIRSAQERTGKIRGGK